MAKRFQFKDGQCFLTNGSAQVRLDFLHYLKLDTHPGRVIKVFLVADVMRVNQNNPIKPADMLALSFREQDCNQKEYVWKAGEEMFVELKLVSAEDIVAEKNAQDDYLT
jgi:hypothetical protein